MRLISSQQQPLTSHRSNCALRIHALSLHAPLPSVPPRSLVAAFSGASGWRRPELSIKPFESATTKGTLPCIAHDYLSWLVVVALVHACHTWWCSTALSAPPASASASYSAWRHSTHAGAVVLSSDSVSSAMPSADTAGQSVGAAVAGGTAAQLASETRGIDDWC
jgi:hypothetical protein